MNDLIDRDKAMKVAMWFGTSEQKYSHSFIKKRVMEIPSARLNNRGICGVCARQEVCGENNRNLDMLECNMFELDKHYKISRPKGKWIEARIGHYPGYECSLCHYGVQPWNNTNYCPSCGADMRERKDFQVIVNGNCTKCGKPIEGNSIFLCDECKSLMEGADDEA